MAKAIFHRRFHWNRPKAGFGFAASPSEKPQSWPRDFIDAAVAAGAATKVPPARSKAGKAGTTKRSRGRPEKSES